MRVHPEQFDVLLAKLDALQMNISAVQSTYARIWTDGIGSQINVMNRDIVKRFDSIEQQHAKRGELLATGLDAIADRLEKIEQSQAVLCERLDALAGNLEALRSFVVSAESALGKRQDVIEGRRLCQHNELRERVDSLVGRLEERPTNGQIALTVADIIHVREMAAAADRQNAQELLAQFRNGHNGKAKVKRGKRK